jgi:hypothetical protein
MNPSKMEALMNRIRLGLIAFFLTLICLSAGACDCGDDDDDNDNNDNDDNDDTGVSIDFEDYSLGPLGSPWIVNIVGPSTATIVTDPTATKAGSGQMLRIDGGTAFNESVDASYTFDQPAGLFDFAFDLYFEPGAIISVLLYDTGGFEYPFSLLFIDGEINASTSSSPDPCETLTADQWYRIGLAVDPSARTYTVSVDGSPTALCTDLEFDINFAGLITQFTFLDIGNLNAGGIVYFDNISLQGVK